MTDNDIVISRKGIIAYLKHKIDLSDDLDVAWNKIRRWKKRYNMGEIIHHLPSGQCYILKSEFQEWIIKVRNTNEDVKEGVKGENTQKIEKCQ